MIVVVAPEPARWIDPVVAAEGGGAAAVWAPWAMPPRSADLPGAAGRFGRRRQQAGADSIAAWPLVELAMRLWSRGRVDRQLRASFATRAAADLWAAARLRRRAVQTVIAPSLGARAAFAEARRRGARTVLVCDLPLLRRLHRDLDLAAEQYPARRFLRRYRADHAVIARQESELVLADVVLVRGAYAREACLELGVEPDRIVAMPPSVTARPARQDPAAPPAAPPQTAARPDIAHSRRLTPPAPAAGAILLAGLAAARHGVDAALEAVAARGRTLWVRVGEGTEPEDLLTRPGVARAPAAAYERLEGVAAVIAPAWCECYPPEVAMAVALGVPVIASRAAAGFAEVVEVVPGAVEPIAAALDRALQPGRR